MILLDVYGKNTTPARKKNIHLYGQIYNNILRIKLRDNILSIDP